MSPRLSFGLLCALVLLVTTGCRSTPVTKDYSRPLPEGVPALVKVPSELFPDVRSLHRYADSAIEAIDESLDYFSKPSSKTHFPYRTDDRMIEHEDQVVGLETLRVLLEDCRSGDEFEQRLYQEFDVYRSAGWDGVSGEVLFTAYYTPIFRGSLRQDSTYRYPLYRRPTDLVTDKDGTPRGRRRSDGTLAKHMDRGS
ncbi:MAG: MltA domain-containing protein [Planctomycetota bacterium]